MALRWLSRVRSTSFLRKHPSSSELLHAARFDQFRRIVSNCDAYFSKSVRLCSRIDLAQYIRNRIDADRFEFIARSALEDPVLQTQAKQALHSFATVHQIDSESRLPDEIGLDLRIALLRESVVVLLEASIPHKINEKLAHALAGSSPSERAHQVRAVIDCLTGEVRLCLQHWVGTFVNIQEARQHQNLHHYPLLFQLCAFVLLSQVYHRSKFISLRQLSDHKDEPFELGLVLVQSFCFLFIDADIQENQSKQDKNGSLHYEISQLKAALESIRTQNQALADENQQMKNQMKQTTSRKQAISELFSNQNVGSYESVWRRIQFGSRRPSPRFKHTAAFDRCRLSLIVYAGIDAEKQLDDIWRFQADRCLWDRPAVRGRIPQGRHSHSAAVAGGHMVVFGGFIGRFCTNETLILDIGNRDWQASSVLVMRPISNLEMDP